MPRTILHLDLDAFFCAVEEQRDPTLRGIAFAVGGQPDQRGVVASCSYPARRFGVRSAMPMAQALRLCPNLMIVPHHYKDYRNTSRQVMELLHDLTPLVEQISIDEAFLDVTGLSPSGFEIAKRLQTTIHQRLNLPCSLGVASNKLVAKIANNISKSRAQGDGPPNAILVVPPGKEAAFLAPLPARELWGIGPKTEARLKQLGITTIGDLAQCSEKQLRHLFGKVGTDLTRRARGIDERPVETLHEAKSISKEITFSSDVRDADILIKTLRTQVEEVGWQLRQAELSGTTVKIKLRWSDFTTITRQVTLTQPTDQNREIFLAAQTLLEQTWPPGKPVRLLGVGISGLDTPRQQLSLWEDEDRTRHRRLQATLDELRTRFGKQMVKRGSDLDQ